MTANVILNVQIGEISMNMKNIQQWNLIYSILLFLKQSQLHHVINIWHHFCPLETLKTLFRQFFLLCSACTLIPALRMKFYRLTAWALRPVKLLNTMVRSQKNKVNMSFCCKVFSLVDVIVSVLSVQSQTRGRDWEYIYRIRERLERDRLCFQWPTATFDCFSSQTVCFSE